MQVKEIFTEAAAGNKILTTFVFDKYLFQKQIFTAFGAYCSRPDNCQFIHKQRSAK